MAATAFWLSSPCTAFAQEQVDDDAIRRSSSMSLAGWELGSQKRRQARDGKWAFLVIGSEDVSFNSNVYGSPAGNNLLIDLEQSSPVFSTGVRTDVFRYFDRRNRLRLVGRAEDQRYTENSNLDLMRQQAGAEYEHRFSRATKLTIDGDFVHENDDAVDINGDPYARNFGYQAYGADLAVEHEISRRHEVAVAYYVDRKNYNETPGMNTLDWREHGPRIRYKYSRGDTRLRVWYTMGIQDYDQEKASLVDGSEIASNPVEHHIHHSALLWLSKTFTPVLSGAVKVKYRAKNDRFQGYESFDEFDVEGEIGYAVSPRLTLSTNAEFERRNYDHRAAEVAGDFLEFNRWTSEVALRYQLNPHAAVLGHYGFVNRNTNRDTGTTYRDYSIRSGGVGVAVAF